MKFWALAEILFLILAAPAAEGFHLRMSTMGSYLDSLSGMESIPKPSFTPTTRNWAPSSGIKKTEKKEYNGVDSNGATAAGGERVASPSFSPSSTKGETVRQEEAPESEKTYLLDYDDQVDAMSLAASYLENKTYPESITEGTLNGKTIMEEGMANGAASLKRTNGRVAKVETKTNGYSFRSESVANGAEKTPEPLVKEAKKPESATKTNLSPSSYLETLAPNGGETNELKKSYTRVSRSYVPTIAKPVEKKPPKTLRRPFRDDTSSSYTVMDGVNAVLDNFAGLAEKTPIDWDGLFQAYNEKQDAILQKQKAYLERQARIVADPNAAARENPNLPLQEPELNTVGMTERIMKRMPAEQQAGGAGGASSWEGFLRAEENWAKLKGMNPRKLSKQAPPEFVTEDGGKGNPNCWVKLLDQHKENKKFDFDVTVCGGTLGIFFATALALKGHKVCVVEGGKLRGREQEWNISMDELMELVKLGVLTKEDIDAAVRTEFPGCRSGFKNMEVTPVKGGYFDNGIGYETVTEDVLNLGISPTILIERVSKRFEELGGVIREQTRLQGVVTSQKVGAAVDLGMDKEPITSRLVIDCMGNSSPITRQSRWGMKPDGICCVVGSCAAGFRKEDNLIGDIIYTNTEMVDKGENGMYQYFWEAFPVGIGRDGKEPGTSDVKTTYMFTYMDAHEKRPSLESLMEDYWRLLPKYQPSIKNPETDLDFKRVLFAYFPTYRESPLKPQWDHILAVGDASGIQSPLSFGGFGALTRHLGRISGAVDEALESNLLTKDDLAEINAYTPNLSAAWMFQRAMSVRMGRRVDPKFVNRLLATNFEVMDAMGKRTIKPFLQDVVRFDGLIGSLVRSFITDPTYMPQIVAHVGIPTLVDWFGHVSMMGAYGFLDSYISPVAGPIVTATLRNDRKRFKWRRRLEAWKYGSGNDYELPKEH